MLSNILISRIPLTHICFLLCTHLCCCLFPHCSSYSRETFIHCAICTNDDVQWSNFHVSYVFLFLSLIKCLVQTYNYYTQCIKWITSQDITVSLSLKVNKYSAPVVKLTNNRGAPSDHCHPRPSVKWFSPNHTIAPTLSSRSDTRTKHMTSVWVILLLTADSNKMIEHNINNWKRGRQKDKRERARWTLCWFTTL